MSLFCKNEPNSTYTEIFSSENDCNWRKETKRFQQDGEPPHSAFLVRDL